MRIQFTNSGTKAGKKIILKMTAGLDAEDNLDVKQANINDFKHHLEEATTNSVLALFFVPFQSPIMMQESSRLLSIFLQSLIVLHWMQF